MEEKLAQMTAEEIEEYEKTIPEWKRGALVTSDGKVQEKTGAFGNLKNRLYDTQTYKDLAASEQGQHLKEVRQNYKDFRANPKDQVETSQSPLVQRTAQVVDTVKMENSCARAVKNMQAYDPYFSFDELEVEAREIFKEFYCNFLTGNLEYVSEISSGPALAICKAEFKLREQEKWSYKYEDLLDCGDAVFQSGEIAELTKAPSFTYVVTTQ